MILFRIRITLMKRIPKPVFTAPDGAIILPSGARINVYAPDGAFFSSIGRRNVRICVKECVFLTIVHVSLAYLVPEIPLGFEMDEYEERD